MLYIFGASQQQAGARQLAVEAIAGLLQHNPLSCSTKENTVASVWISPNLKKADGSPVTLQDFPDGFSFGNGVTCNATVALKDGSILILSWLLTPADLIPGKLTAVQQIMEGS